MQRALSCHLQQQAAAASDVDVSLARFERYLADWIRPSCVG